MRFVALILCLILSLSTNGSVITGTLVDLVGVSTDAEVVFTRVDLPIVSAGGGIVPGTTYRTRSVNGAFTTGNLAQGKYQVSIRGFNWLVVIPNDSLTYTFAQVVTNHVVYSSTNELHKVRVSANDTTAGTLSAKLIVSGGTLSVTNSGANEQYLLTVTPGTPGATNFTGDVTGSGTGSVGLTLAQDRVRKAGDSMTGALTVNPGTVTVNTPSLTASQTWNGAGSFEAITASITDTASASGSYPFVARVGGSSVFYARKDGLVFGSASGQFGGSTVNGTSLQLSADGFVGRIGGTSGGNTAYGTTYLWTRSPGNLEFTVDSDNSDTTQTIRFARDSGTLGGGTTMTEWTQGGEFRFQNGSGSALLKVFSAFTDTLNGAWLGLDAQGASGRLRLGSEFNGTGTALPLDFRHGFGTGATLQTNGTFSFAAIQITNLVDSISENLSGTSPAANWATQGVKTITLSGNTTFTFSNTPTGNGYVRSLAVKVLGNGSHTIAFPGTVDWQTSTIGTPRATDWTDYLFEYRDGTVYGYASDGGALDADLTAIAALTGTGVPNRTGSDTWELLATSGTGNSVRATSPTITTPTISGAITFPDGVRQTFNPDGTAAGLNVGSQAGDPSSPTNGDVWYDSTANELTARINGANVALGAGGGSPTTTRGDLIRRGASADERMALGTIGMPVISDGTDSVFMNPANHVRIFEEFIGSNGSGQNSWNTSGNVLSGQASAFEFAGRPGLAAVYGTSGNHGAIHLGLTSMLLGGGAVTLEWWIYFPDLSTAGDEYVARFGLGDALNADHADGVYFEYDRTASTNWRIVTAANSTRTKSNTSTAVAEDTWTKLRIVVNAGGTSVSYYINGTEVSGSPLSTNIPTGSGQWCGPNMHVIKTAGTNTRYVVADWFSFFMAPTSAR